ncbi:MAG: Signal recognition particle subunit SRP72 [Sporothrix thermara]
MASAVNALNSLLRGTSIDDHEEALKLANAAIATGKAGSASVEQLTALHAKVVALLKLDRFDDALRTVAAGGDALAARCVVERAYALYKTGDLDAAAELCSNSSSSNSSSTEKESRALKHVAAQVAYRAEDFDRAAALYSGLTEDAETADAAAVGEATDVRINALAVSAQRAWQGRGLTTVSAGQDASLDAGRREDLDSFEMAYNAACVALSRGDVSRASVLLRRAQQLCEGSDELSDEDKQSELLPILIQQVYALTRLGRHDDAAALQKAIDASETEGSAKVVASTNSVVLRNSGSGNSGNPYVVQRQIEAIPTPPSGSDRLFSHQARILRRNQYAIELQCFKFKGVLGRTAKQLKQNTSTTATLPDTVDLGIYGAAAKAELQTGKDALRRILPLLEHRPDDIGLLLTAIQLQLQANNAEAALSLLEAFFSRSEQSAARFAPGLVALAVALYKLQGRRHAVRTELAKALAHWQLTANTSSTASSSSSPSPPPSSFSSSSSSSAVPASLLRAAGVELLHSQDPADQAAATAAFEKLHAASPSDKTAVAGLVASLAAAQSAEDSSASPAQIERQQKLAQALTPVDQLIKGVDVASLLQGGVAALSTAAPVKSKKRSAAAATAGEDAGAADGQAAKKTKTTGSAAAAPKLKLSRQARKLQAKSEKEEGSFDLNKKMDPERWLPLRDRSSYRPPKGKKGRGRRGEAATMQGGVVKEEETLVLAGGAGSVRVEKAPQGPSGSGAAKKRKKGKK